MGYYTKHDLSVYDGEHLCSSEDARLFLEEKTGYSSLFYEPCKWYKHQEDMKVLSEKHPKVVFLLEGNGEEKGYLWREYWVNGKVHAVKAQITYEVFDRSKLK